MRLLLLIFALGILNNVFGQTNSDLEKLLLKEFPEKSKEDGRWVYYAGNANITKLDKPLVKEIIPNFDFYKCTLTNYLGYHINEATCLILYDSATSKIILVEPLWYGGINESLIKLFINKQFESENKLMIFLNELNELMEIGSGYKFINTINEETLINYDLVYLKGDSLTTSGNGINSIIQYNKNGIWRKIEITKKGLQIKMYKSINPVTQDEEIVK